MVQIQVQVQMWYRRPEGSSVTTTRSSCQDLKRPSPELSCQMRRKASSPSHLLVLSSTCTELPRSKHCTRATTSSV